MKNDIKTRIDKFIKKYPEPYQFKITLNWKRKDGTHSKTYFPNNESGLGRYYWKRSEFYTYTGKDFIAQHFRYDEKLGLLELAYAVFDCHVPKAGENRRWKYSYRYFIPKGTRELYDAQGNQGHYDYKLVSYDGYVLTPDKFAQMFCKVNNCSDMFIKEFMAFAGDNLQLKNCWHSHITKESRSWELEYWFLYKPKSKTTGKVQKAIDKLASMTPDLSEDVASMIKSAMERTDLYYKKISWLDLDRKVFRCFTASGNDIAEDKRVYIDDKGKFIVATINPSNEWVTNGSFTNRQFNFKVVNLDDVYKLPYCEYLKDVIRDKPQSLYYIVSAMKNSEIEQLANMGMHNLARNFYGRDNLAAYIKEMFGAPNKKHNILAKYGVNKKQIEYVDKAIENRNNNGYYYYRSYNSTGIGMIKELFHISNVASLDYDTFIKYYKFVSDLDWSGRRVIANIPEEMRQKTVNKLCNMYDKHNNVLTLFSDTVRTYQYLNAENKPNIDVYALKSYDELVRLHNTCVELKRIEDEERRRLWDMEEAERHAILEKKMAKLDEERSRFNYSDDDFTIRLPEKLSEIVNEGSSLRHCVGGYTTSHAEGHTTIMFLRRNDDPTTSFYTIEIRNDNVIQQIHGFGNRWLGNDPEAIPTVMRWLAANNLSCSDEILLSTAKGYCSGSAPLVEKPII